MSENENNPLLWGCFENHRVHVNAIASLFQQICKYVCVSMALCSLISYLYTDHKQLFQHYTDRGLCCFTKQKEVPAVKCIGWMKIVDKTNFEHSAPPGGEFVIKRNFYFATLCMYDCQKHYQ